jgi:hypothetical protein
MIAMSPRHISEWNGLYGAFGVKIGPGCQLTALPVNTVVALEVRFAEEFGGAAFSELV